MYFTIPLYWPHSSPAACQCSPCKCSTRARAPGPSGCGCSRAPPASHPSTPPSPWSRPRAAARSPCVCWRWPASAGPCRTRFARWRAAPGWAAPSRPSRAHLFGVWRRSARAASGCRIRLWFAWTARRRAWSHRKQRRVQKDKDVGVFILKEIT